MVSKIPGGGAIYSDGDPLLEQVANGESLSVPAGETWVVTVAFVGNPQDARLNNSQITSQDTERDIVLSGGDTVEQTYTGSTDSTITISGWVL